MKKVLLVAVFFFNLLLTTPMVQASQEIAPQEPVEFKVTDSTVYNTSMSKKRTTCPSRYVEAEQELTMLVDFSVGNRSSQAERRLNL